MDELMLTAGRGFRAGGGRQMRLVLALLGLSLLAAHARGQSLLEQDIQLGLAFHDAIVRKSPVVEGPQAARLRGIFHRLVETLPVRVGPQLPHRIFMIDSSAPNAFATGGGRVYVTTLLSRLAS
jgi:predicted Zn-dependent protease